MTASPTITGYRPRIGKIQRYDWKHGDQSTPGVVLKRPGNGKILAHLTPSEAVDLADRMVDLTETMEQDQHHA